MTTETNGLERALEARYYTDPELFAREHERIFHRTWQFAGHVSQIERPGDYFTFELGGQNLFTIRTADGEVRTQHETPGVPGAIGFLNEDGEFELKTEIKGDRIDGAQRARRADAGHE